MKGNAVKIKTISSQFGIVDPQNLLEGLPIGVAFFDKELYLTDWNRTFATLLGLTDTFLAKPCQFRDFIGLNWNQNRTGDHDLTGQIFSELRTTPCAGDLGPLSYEYCLVNNKWLEVKGNPLPNGGYVLLFADITSRKEVEDFIQHNSQSITDQLIETYGHRKIMEEQAAEAVRLAEDLAIAQQEAEDSARRIQAILNAMADGLVTVDTNGVIQTANHAVEEMFGYAQNEILGQNLLLLLHSQLYKTENDLISSINSLIETEREYKREETGRRKDGRTFPIEISLREVNFIGQKQFTVLIRDVTERHEAEATIRKMALHDSLTGLANRNLLHQRLNDALKMAKRLGKKVAVMFLDLDLFKPVNDLYGHATGDKLLQIVAERLSKCAREVDTVARLGGDEFAIVFTNLDDESHVTKIARRIIDNIQLPIEVDDKILSVGTSVGISFYPHDSKDPNELIRMADVALYQAKDDGRRIFRIYDPKMDASAKAEKEIEMELSNAIKNGELFLHFQPQIDSIDNSVVGAEALARWKHPKKGFIPPDSFIAIAENSGLIIPLGQWILETACRQAKAWQDRGIPPFRVCVNISAKQFQLKNFCENVQEALIKSNLDARWLELEITEGMVIADKEEVITKLEKLASLGVTLAIDDFGTGYSSLAYLKRFSVHQLKIDQSFIRDITEDHDDAAITDAVIRLGHSLGLTVVAEGVETEEHVQLLRQKGCDVMQGYYFSRPLDARAFEVWLEQYNSR
ncbi:EAL domain-containing protein [Luteithermobacter gelatinilyticus]|uniref:EAL domain-containing protein n=1 Tax=Luteithermobacter gelatinilyticus TaxID=2582913 RepID=UPI001106B539|nr:EAL domain-containing protein [Luteithermobacter gelatinilyticus]